MMEEKKSFNVEEQFNEWKQPENRGIRREKLEELLESQTEQRLASALFVAELVSNFDQEQNFDIKQAMDLMDKYQIQTRWTDGQREKIIESFKTIEQRHSYLKKLKAGGMNDEDIFKHFFDDQKPIGNIETREVAGGIVFLTDNHKDFCTMDREQGGPFETNIDEKEAAETGGKFLGPYRNVYKFKGAVIIVNNKTIHDKKIEASEKGDSPFGLKDGEKLDENQIREKIILHESFHLWADNFLDLRVQKFSSHREFGFKKEETLQSNSDRVFFKLQDEIIAYLIEGSTREKILREMKDFYLENTERALLLTDDRKDDKYQKEISFFFLNLESNIIAGQEIFEQLGKDPIKTALVLSSEKIQKWSRLAEQIRKYFSKIETLS